MHHYHSLQKTLDAHPMGAPMAEEFMEILNQSLPATAGELVKMILSEKRK